MAASVAATTTDRVDPTAKVSVSLEVAALDLTEDEVVVLVPRGPCPLVTYCSAQQRARMRLDLVRTVAALVVMATALLIVGAPTASAVEPFTMSLGAYRPWSADDVTNLGVTRLFDNVVITVGGDGGLTGAASNEWAGEQWPGYNATTAWSGSSSLSMSGRYDFATGDFSGQFTINVTGTFLQGRSPPLAGEYTSRVTGTFFRHRDKEQGGDVLLEFRGTLTDQGRQQRVARTDCVANDCTYEIEWRDFGPDQFDRTYRVDFADELPPLCESDCPSPPATEPAPDDADPTAGSSDTSSDEATGVPGAGDSSDPGTPAPTAMVPRDDGAAVAPPEGEQTGDPDDGVAAGSPTEPAQPGAPDQADDTGRNPVVIAGVVVGVGVGAAAVAAGVRKVRAPRTGGSTPAAGPAPASSPHTPSPQDEIARLQQIRSEMQAEIASEIGTYQQVRRDRAALIRLQKKNMLKFVMKQGLETALIGPEEALQKLLPESIQPRPMERIFEKHDTSKDGQIIVETNKRILNMKGQMQQHIDNVRYLRTEINKIDQRIAAGGSPP